ncbi:helicase-exonuclease AddAB subunit AddB [Bacillota bacterium]
MLRIYYGREDIDKEKAMFNIIGQSLPELGKPGGASQILLLVPDQYTLQMERNAIENLKVKGLIDLEVLSFSRLAGRVLKETGGSRRVPIDKHGRHMLLTKILKDEEENLTAFRSMNKSHSFIDLTNNLISEIKQQNSSPEDIRAAIEQLEDSGLLKSKLNDILIIFERYEEHIKDKYIDTEDHLNFFISQIGQSAMTAGTEFWISGFDSFTPKSIKIIEELIAHSKGVNVVLTSDNRPEDQGLFRLTRDMMLHLEDAAGSKNAEKRRLEGPVSQRPPAIGHLEQNLFAYPFQPFEEDSHSLKFCRAANFYSEAETAAAFICKLVRDEGMRFRDIAVICNDMEGRGAIIKRVFDEYGISCFMDQKRHALHNPAIVFIISLLDAIQSSWAYDDLFRLVKTGFSPLAPDDAEDLENYAIRYRIKGNRWKKDFRYGEKEYGGEEFKKLNGSRGLLADFLSGFEEKYKSAGTVKARTEVLLGFLKETAGLEAQLENLCLELEADSELEAAMELQQIWESVLDLFDQLIELMGEEAISHEDYGAMLKSGFESIELGLIPTTIDQVVIGTMQRTRMGRIKALIVLGANDGILPADDADEGLLNRDEKALLVKKDIRICKDDDLRSTEERLAIYKQLSRPEKYLYISFSASDTEGKEIRPSLIFDKMKKLFPRIEIQKDIRNMEDSMVLVDRPESSLKHLAEALRKAEAGDKELDPVWEAVFNWYKKNDDRGFSLLISGLEFTNKVEKLKDSLLSKIFGRQDSPSLQVSPSRLERFSRCPFAHFVHYGLAPEEKRLFEVAGREAGDVYHRCLMLLAERLTIKGIPLTDRESPWMRLTEEECGLMVAAIIEGIVAEYKEGMLSSGEEEKYRTSRMREVCERAAWALVEHVRQGQINEIYFEEAFGVGDDKLLPPISIDVGGREFFIEGKIDRVDVLPGDYVKIIDYKSGKERFDPREALGGWRLQLMLYLKAVTDGMKALNREVKPAGVFYFEIADPMINVGEYDEGELKQKLEGEIRKQFKLDGVVLGDPAVIDNIAGEFSGYSDVLPIRKSKEGIVSGSSEGKLLSEDEFRAFQEAMDSVITKLCSSLASGVIAINPKKNKDQTACKYCDYKSICNFELSFDGCSYDVVK